MRRKILYPLLLLLAEEYISYIFCVCITHALKSAKKYYLEVMKKV